MRRSRMAISSWTTGAVGLALVAILALTGSGCGRNFEPFNLVNKLRVLAVRAEPPSLAAGESAELSALVFEPDGDDIAYSWSWCPIATGALGGFECAIDEQELRDLVDEVAPGAGELLPGYDLGAAPEAAFDYAVPAQLLQGLCELATSAEAPAFVALPDCDDSLVISIFLRVSAGGESVTAIKELPLYFDVAGADNENPAIGEVTAAIGEGAPTVLTEEEAATLLAGRRHRIIAGVPSSSAQVFQPAPTDDDPEPEPERESLFMTWFVTGGDTEDSRTTFIDGDISLEELGTNRWTTPDDTDEASLFLVLQDERGGVGWTRHDVQLGEE